MIPTITETGINNDYQYEDDFEVRIIHGFAKAMTYAHPATRKEIGIVIKVKGYSEDGDLTIKRNYKIL